VAQNVYNNKNLQGEFSDPDSPYYQGESGTDENGNPVGNCVEINAGCTAGQEEIEDYIGDEIIIIGSSGESLYYYHPDHLGSASVITDGSGNLREHIEYFAFGETWVQEGASKKTPFMYTGKELDQETGLYYYGARYYDPRTSVWQSVDPILEKYLPSGDPEKDKNLPGMGGVFNSANLAGFTYTHQNPVRYVDPDGNAVAVAARVGCAAGGCEALAALGAGTTGSLLLSSLSGDSDIPLPVAFSIFIGDKLGLFSFNESGDASDKAANSATSKAKYKGKKGKTKHYDDEGGQGAADDLMGKLRDLEGATVLSPDDGERERILLPDGTTVNKHPSAGGKDTPQGAPTIEFDRPKGKSDIKIRFLE